MWHIYSICTKWNICYFEDIFWAKYWHQKSNCSTYVWVFRCIDKGRERSTYNFILLITKLFYLSSNLLTISMSWKLPDWLIFGLNVVFVSTIQMTKRFNNFAKSSLLILPCSLKLNMQSFRGLASSKNQWVPRHLKVPKIDPITSKFAFYCIFTLQFSKASGCNPRHPRLRSPCIRM